MVGNSDTEGEAYGFGKHFRGRAEQAGGWIGWVVGGGGKERAELSLGRLLLLAWTTEWMVRESPGLDAGLLFRPFLNKHTRTKMCTYEEKGHLPVENTERGTELKTEMTSPW